jgi:primosomal replication protein N
MSRKNPPKWAFNMLRTNYLFITYIVTSKPKRISVAAGVVHIVFLLVYKSLAVYKLISVEISIV